MTKYDISKEFGILRNLKPPFNKSLFALAEVVLTDKSKYLKNDDNIMISKEKIKMNDGEFINIYIYEPENLKTNKVLLYIHGGGFVYEGNSTHFKLCRRYSLEGNCKVIYVDYRRTPKYPYPIPLNDCFYVYKWILENASKLKIDSHKIIVGGDSAGGCLAVDTTLKAIQESIIKPCYLMLVYPVLDKRMITKSMKKYVDTPMWNAKLHKKMWDCYLQGKKYVSPSEIKDLSVMPPTYIETAEYDCLHDEGVEFINRLNEVGIPTILNETKGTMHGFDMKSCPITETAIKTRIEVLKSIK